MNEPAHPENPSQSEQQRLRIEQLEQQLLELSLQNRQLQQQVNGLTSRADKLDEVREMAAIGVYELDHISGKFQANDELGWLLGCESSALDSWQKFIAFLSPEMAEVLESQVNASLNEQLMLELDIDVTHANGEQKYFKHHMKHFYAANGLPLSSVGLLQDLTVERRTLAELRQANHAAQAASVAKTQFLATMSHEIRTPMNAILGFTELLKHDRSLTLKQQRAVDTILQSGQHLLTILNSILDMAKIEAGKLELLALPFNLHRLLLHVQSVFTGLAEQKQLQFECDIAQNVPQWVVGDEGKVRQILYNVLGNAMKFTLQGGVRLSAYVIACHEDAVQIGLRVVDSGIGIAQQQLSAIFEPFHQVDGANQTTTGTGLGLSISSQLAKLMQGEIAAHSTLGQGSEFTISLVLAVSQELAKQASRSQPVGLTDDSIRPSVLVVDDQAFNRELLHTILTDLALPTTTAEDGEQAIAHWQAEQPDLILMDIMMPKLDGIHAMQQIRAASGGKQVPIVAITASALGDEVLKIYQAGFDAVLIKPVQYQQLLHTLAQQTGVSLRYESEQDCDTHQVS